MKVFAEIDCDRVLHFWDIYGLTWIHEIDEQLYIYDPQTNSILHTGQKVEEHIGVPSGMENIKILDSHCPVLMDNCINFEFVRKVWTEP